MKRIGMIGGMGPESTLDYYRLLIELYREKAKDGSSPEIIINSMDLDTFMKLAEKKDWDGIVAWLSEGIEVLHKAGADFGFISANTPHIVFDRISELSHIPLISIVDTTCARIKKFGLKKVGLLGTRTTMENDFYGKAGFKNGFEVFAPNPDEIDYIHSKLMTEIELGNFLDETRNRLLDIIKRMIDDNSIEGVILGCTELPLILTKEKFGIPFFNTTRIHVESIIEYYLYK
ncbi:MAG: amino acid racemase [Bacillota bacterium]|nr:amino acid racemase [Bacillota bacterium]